MSYTSQQFLVADNSTLANFKSWGGAVSAALGAMGWAKTADTGQVNWSTIASVPSGAYVYEIWHPGDALQTGASAFYLRVRYGWDSATFTITFTLATGTDGSGGLTGYVAHEMAPNAPKANFSPSTTYECDFSGDTNRLGMMLWAGTYLYLVAIERTKNVDGTDSADGVTGVWSAGGASGQQTLVFLSGPGILSQDGCFVALTDGNNGSGALAGNIPVSPVFPAYGRYGNPMTTVGFVHTQDVADGGLFSTTLYGATRTFMAHNPFQAINSPPYTKWVLRYD